MKLIDLNPQFLKYETNKHIYVDSLNEAQGMSFDCPNSNHGHMMVVWFANKGVPDEAFPRGARWPVTGTGYHDLTLTPSILFQDDWHGFITNGEVTNCS